ncbi:MAG: helicase C-terminal domain-containing protein [Candidatus Eisenbacteria bacterium]|nr:helicase C-terminal domain-containing protein [Candidatus Eisenbacteria bacterium]
MKSCGGRVKGGNHPTFEDEVRQLFSKNGPISESFPSYEIRPEQIEYATEVANLLAEEGILVVEAGTGVGKSIAYLIPSISWAARNGKRVTVSTHTRNLQNQLIISDIPLARKALSTSVSYFSLKGKANYLCLRRWEEVREGSLSLDARDSEAVACVEEWLGNVAVNEAPDLSYPGAGNSALWSMVCAEGLNCNEEECDLRENCILMKARRRAFQATVLVVNHSLLVRDFALGGGYLPERDFLIIDEAHNIEKVVTEELSVSLGRDELRNLVIRSMGKGRSGGMIRRIKKRLRFGRGRKGKGGALENISSSLFSFSEALDVELEQIETTFIPNFELERRVRYDESLFSPGGKDTVVGMANMFAPVSASFQECEKLIEGMDEHFAARAPLLELRALQFQWSTIFENFLFLSDPSRPEYVYWAECQRGGTLALRASPLSVSEKTRMLFSGTAPRSLLTSATMTVEGSFDYFTAKVGLGGGETGKTVLLGSPFDYEKNVFFGTASDFPVPGENDGIEAAIRSLGNLLSDLQRNALVLFTSHDSLRRCYSLLKHSLDREGIQVVGQGIDGTASEIGMLFRDSGPRVLLGTSSLWEGVDFPGEELELLVIARLPFPVPKDPLVEARCERLISSGFDPFLSLSLPEAVTRFRQGFGRLIRRKGDRGACIVLDPRITTKAYGRAFVSSVPSELRVFRRKEDLFDNVRDWFS